MFSDIHLGTIVGRSRLDSLVERSRHESDLSASGDIVARSGTGLSAERGSLRNLGPGSVLRVTGKPRSSSGAESLRIPDRHNVTMLRDEVRHCRGLVWSPGGSLLTVQAHGSLEKLMAGSDRKSPIVLMDHQPFGLDEAPGRAWISSCPGTPPGAALPVNYIIRAIYELGWGYAGRATPTLCVQRLGPGNAGSHRPRPRSSASPELSVSTSGYSTPISRKHAISV